MSDLNRLGGGDWVKCKRRRQLLQYIRNGSSDIKEVAFKPNAYGARSVPTRVLASSPWHTFETFSDLIICQGTHFKSGEKSCNHISILPKFSSMAVTESLCISIHIVLVCNVESDPQIFQAFGKGSYCSLVVCGI